MSDRNNDFSLLVKLLNSFLKNEDIKRRLYSFVSNETNDWEKWLQIEFEHFLNKKRKYEVKREVTAFLAPNNFPASKLSKIDIIMREKDTLFEDYIFIELKCTKRSSALKRGLQVDHLKLNSIQECKYPMRNSFCVGFHLYCSSSVVEEMDKYVTDTLKGSYAVFKLCECPTNRHCDCALNEIGVVLC